MNEVFTKRVSIKDAYLRSWVRWGDYKGRSSRQEYWKWFLANALIFLFIGILSTFLGKWLLIMCYSACFGPAMAITIRRLHDAGHTGKWLMPGVISSVIFLVVALVGSLSATPGTVTTIPPRWVIVFAVLLVVLLADAITIFVFLCQCSAPDNAWGPAPQQHTLSLLDASDLSGGS